MPDNLWDNTCGDTKEENVINEENRYDVFDKLPPGNARGYTTRKGGRGS